MTTRDKMVKSIVIEESANSSLSQLLQAKHKSNEISRAGLLIGTIDQSKDYILSVIGTPVNDAGEGEAASDKEWIVNHALQVHDMLIGGMDILGIYCIDFTPALAKQIVFQLFKSLNKFEYYKQMRFNTDRLVFLVDSSSKTINMKCVDVKAATEGGEAAKGATFQPCEIKVQVNLLENEFKRIDSNFNFNTKFKTPNIKSHNLLKEDFYNALSVEEMFDNQKFVCLINDTLIEESRSFSECVKSLNDTEYFACLMENLSKKEDDSDLKTSSTKLKNQNLDSIYELTGVCYLIVQIHKSFRVQHIKRLLIYDLLRSLYARVRLLVEDLDARKEIIGDAQLEDPNSNDASSIEESYQTPNRIFIYTNQKNNNRMIISDYVFPDETDTDISERIKQLFDYDIVDTKNDIVYVEDLPPEIKSSQSENDNNIETSTHSGQFSSNSSSGSNTNLNSGANSEGGNFFRKGLVYLTASCAAVASVIISYYSFRAANFLNYDDTDYS